MTGRHFRHERIQALIGDRAIRSQQELQELLADDGISVTQATLSRDLRELDVAKSADGYRLTDDLARGGANGPTNGSAREARLGQLLRRELVGADVGGSMVVLRTAPGHADAVAIEIDRARSPDIIGTIAGDDTIFVAARSDNRARTVLERLRALAEHQADDPDRRTQRGERK
jgi:transcriptional regulator of arginine metabolism